MRRTPLLRAGASLVAAVAGVGGAASQAGFPAVAGAVGVRVGLPGAGVELARAALPIVVALLVAGYALRFGVRALRRGVTLAEELAAGGALLATTAWAAWAWLVVELLYRQLYLGWATLFGTLGVALTVSAVVVALAVAAERLVPWARAPRGVRHLGLAVVVAVALLTALSAWSHRGVVPRMGLVPIAAVGVALLVSGVRRVEGEARPRALVELGLASALLAGPLWGILA